MFIYETLHSYDDLIPRSLHTGVPASTMRTTKHPFKVIFKCFIFTKIIRLTETKQIIK